MHHKRMKRLFLPFLLLLVLCAGALYAGQYYHADSTAAAALSSDSSVTVSETDYGWHFDGPCDDTALIFYPGAKVEETAYAPLLRLLAAGGIDVCLVRMPLRLAILGMNRADAALRAHSYSRWIIGGHSLGGACASHYAAKSSGRLDGLILLAAYPMSRRPDDLDTLLLYGTEDGVLNRQAYDKKRSLAPAGAKEAVIEGGNHAQFGAYGSQKGDGAARIPARQQQEETVRIILQHVLQDGAAPSAPAP